MRLDMSPVLCESCLSLFDRSKPSSRDLEHHRSLNELKAAAQDGCKVRTILCENVAIANETRPDASIRSGYSELSLDAFNLSHLFTLSFSIFPPTTEAGERYDRYGMRFDKLADFWVIEDGCALCSARHILPTRSLTLNVASAELASAPWTLFKYGFSSDLGPCDELDCHL